MEEQHLKHSSPFKGKSIFFVYTNEFSASLSGLGSSLYVSTTKLLASSSHVYFDVKHFNPQAKKKWRLQRSGQSMPDLLF